MGNPNKDSKGGANLTSPRMFARLLETLASVAEAVTREMAKAHAHYQALLNERSTAAVPTSLKVTSGASGFKVMDPFDWTKEKDIYQR